MFVLNPRVTCFALPSLSTQFKSADAGCYHTSSGGPRVQVAVDLTSPAGRALSVSRVVALRFSVMGRWQTEQEQQGHGFICESGEGWIRVSVSRREQ